MKVKVSVSKSVTKPIVYHLVFDDIYFIRINKPTFERVKEAIELYKKIK